MLYIPVLNMQQYILYCYIQNDQLKKTILRQKLIKIYTATHQIAHFWKTFSDEHVPE